MTAKKHQVQPAPDADQAEQTRKVDSMSEIVAGMLLEDPDATSPPPEASPGSLSAVRPTTPRPRAYAIEEQPRRPRVARVVVIVLVVALGLVVAAALLRAAS